MKLPRNQETQHSTFSYLLENEQQYRHNSYELGSVSMLSRVGSWDLGPGPEVIPIYPGCLAGHYLTQYIDGGRFAGNILYLWKQIKRAVFVSASRTGFSTRVMHVGNISDNKHHVTKHVTQIHRPTFKSAYLATY